MKLQISGMKRERESDELRTPNRDSREQRTPPAAAQDGGSLDLEDGCGSEPRIGPTIRSSAARIRRVAPRSFRGGTSAAQADRPTSFGVRRIRNYFGDVCFAQHFG